MGAETRTTSSTGAAKGVKKQAYDLIPPLAVNELAKLYGRGAAKYAPNNFRLGYETKKSYAAGQRHGSLFWSGEDLDSETGCHHLTSYIWHIFTIIESNITHPGFDSRPYGGATHPKDTPPLHQIAGVGLAEMEEHMSLAPARQTIPVLTGGENDTLVFRHDLVPLRPLALISEVFGTFPDLAEFSDEDTFGTFYGQSQAYIFSYWSGQDIDPVTGMTNLALAATFGLLALELALRHPEKDDRFRLGAPIGFDSVPVTAAPKADDADEIAAKAVKVMAEVSEADERRARLAEAGVTGLQTSAARPAAPTRESISQLASVGAPGAARTATAVLEAPADDEDDAADQAVLHAVLDRPGFDFEPETDPIIRPARPFAESLDY